MERTHADRILRTAKSLRSSILIVLEHLDDLCDLIESRSAHCQGECGERAGPTQTARLDSTPRVDRARLTVSWRGKECYLGYTLPFRLIERFAQRPNQFIPTDRLQEDLWAGFRAPSTIRSAVSQLRAKLIAAGMGELATLIDGSNPGHYGLMLARAKANPTGIRQPSDAIPTDSSENLDAAESLSRLSHTHPSESPSCRK
jgi:hypothetical protein